MVTKKQAAARAKGNTKVGRRARSRAKPRPKKKG